MQGVRFGFVLLATSLAAAPAAGQLPDIPLPQMPHLPEPKLRIPEVNIPPVELPNIPIGHKTNKWEIRHNLEKGGWWVAYGKEIGYQEYYEFYQAVGASVASGNPGPVIAFLGALLAESAEVLVQNAGKEFKGKVQELAKKEIVAAMQDAIQNGKVRTLRLRKVEFQIGMATYNRSESGAPLPNTFQPYMRMRLTLDHGDGPAPAERPKYHWVTTVHNPTGTEVKYRFSYGGEWKAYSVPAKGWRWHSHDSADEPSFKISFDTGPAGAHKDREYHLNCHRLLLGTKPDANRGEPYVFRYSQKKGWELFHGRP